MEQGIEEGKRSAAHEITVLRAKNETLHKQIGQLLEQSNGSATGQLVATETAITFVVENQQLTNKVASLELTTTAQADELVNTKRIVEEQARELATLRKSSAEFLGVYRTTGSAHRPASSPYLKSKTVEPK